MKKKPILFKFLIVALPLGLILLGGLSLIWHLRNPHSLEKAPINQPKAKAVGKTDLEFYVKKLAEDVGARPSTDAVKSRQTAAFLQGVLGDTNMGYLKVQSESFPLPGNASGGTAENISVEIRGVGKPNEIVIVGASYDSAPDSAGANDNGTGVAANLALAHLFLGTSPVRTVRFYFFANGHGAAPTGAETLANFASKRGENIVAMWSLDSLGHYNDSPGSQQPWPDAQVALPSAGNFVAFVGAPKDKAVIENYKSSFNADASLTAQSILSEKLEDPAATAFNNAGYSAVRITDTGRHRYNSIDIPGAIHFEHFADVVRALGRMLQEVAGKK